MKKEASKKKKLGLIIAIAAVVLLAIVGVVLALLLGGGQGKEEKLQSKLYWNIDGKSMLSEETAMSTRKPAEDGLFYIRYLVGGEIVEIPFADRKLVTQADRRELACLKFDADGIAIEVIEPEELYVRIQDKTYVQAINGNSITTNTSTVLNGMKKQLELPEDVPVVNVSTRTGEEEIGEKVEVEIFDQLLIYGTDEETITDIFLTDRYWESKIYWSPAARAHYDTSKKVSTRPLADDGYWYIDLVCEGETKTYRTAKQDVINVLDSKGPTDAATGVVFDENGDIIDLFNAGLACRGTLQASSFDVTNLSEDGKTFTATRIMFGTEIGKTYTGNITENTQIYNMTATADVFGEPTELQMNDRLLVYQAADGSIHTIFVVNRMVDSPFYYNLSQAWSSVNGLTRVPNEDGYYVYELAVDGKVKTVRTKDKALATKMDGMNLRVFGLKLKGDVVVKVYDAVNVAGNWSFASNNFVQTTEGGILGTVSTTGTAANGVMAADCKVFDVSQCYKNFRGEKTTVREGDQILAYQNAVGEVTHIWVLNRYVKGTTIYWNMNRYYANGETSRTPDENGYYVFNCIKAGTTKVVQLKTKDKEVASRFDKENSTTAAALKVSGDIIKAAYPAPAAIGGYYRLAGFWVHELNFNDDPTCYALIARTGAIGSIFLAEDCKVMNFSAVTKKATGESTQLKEGDYVWPIAGPDGKVHYIFIIEREVDGSKLAWRKNTLATMKDAEGKVMQDKNGNNMLVADKDGNYVFTLWVNGKIGTYKTKDLKLANYVNSRATGFAVTVKGSTITGAYPISSQPDTRSASVSYYDYVKISDGVMTLKRNRVGQTDTGNEMTVPVADNYKAYNFDPASGDDWGKQVKLNKGDRVYAYQNNNGESYIFFIMYRCTLEGGNMRYCDHCGKKVHWESMFAGFSPAAGCIPEVAHYYLPVDYANTGMTFGAAVQTTEGKGTEIIFDLNGKTLTRKGTLNETDGIKYAPGAALTAGYGNTLRIVDFSKKNTGKMVTEADALYNGAGSLLHVQQGSKLIIDEGLFDGSKGSVNYTAANGGTISVGGELIINGGTIKGRASNGNGSVAGGWGGSSITINGGTLVGNTMGEGVKGATGFGGVIATNGNLTITGGKISGGNAIKGDNIFVGNPNAEVSISGGTIDGGIQIDAAKSVKLSGKPQIAAGKNYGLKLANNMKIDATGLKAGAKVYVDASGVFTTDFASAKAAQAVLDNGMLKAGAEGMMLKVQGKAIASVSDGKLRQWTDSTKLPDMGRWKLMTDVKVNTRKDVTGDLYIDLNGHDITRTVASDATTACQVFRVAGKLTIDDTSAAADGTVSTAYADGQAICDYSAVIHVVDGAEFILEGGIIDGSNVDNTYVNAANGTISVGGKLVVNGGVIKGVKRGSGSGGAVGGWAGTEIIVNGGKIYAGGSFLQDNGNQKVNGAAIATTGKLTVNGGEIIGPGASSTAEQRARSGGLIYANGDSMTILGGKFYDGFGTGYGFNIYYERSYLGTAGADGKRPTVNGGGEVIIGGDAYINGGVTIRSAKSAEPVKLTVKDTAVIDSTGAVAATNIRLYNGELYLNADKTAITSAPADTNYDISIVYTCKNAPKGFSVGNQTKYEHSYNGSGVCTECGHDKFAVQDWTDGTALPTEEGVYRLMTNVTVNSTVTTVGDVTIDLNGFDIVRNVAENALAAPQVFRVSGKLTITDTSAAADGTVSIAVPEGKAINNYSALIHVPEGGNEFVLQGGTLDASNVDNTYVNANSGAVSVGGKFTMEGGVIKGFKRGSGNGGAVGGWAGSEILIKGGQIYAGGTFLNGTTQKVNGAGIATTGELTVTGGEFIGPGKDSTAEQRARSGGLVYANGDKLTILGGTFRDGFGTGYGFNIYYERNYRGAADPATGVRPTITGGGEVLIGGDAFIKGGVTIRSSKAADPVKLTVRDTATIDDTGAVGNQNIRLTNGELYLNADTTPITSNAAANKVDANYDVSLVHKCDTKEIVNFVTGHQMTLQHNMNADNICSDCGEVKMALTLSKTTVELDEGAEETITVTDKKPAASTVTWASDNDAVATVADGKITAVAAGTAKITATATYGEHSVVATVNVTVKTTTPPPASDMETAAWTDWTDATKLPTAGKYRLTTPVTTASTTLTGELWLDLNGQTVTCATGNVIITAGHDLLIDDLSGKTGDELGCIKTTATSGSARAAVIYANVGTTASTFTLNNGIIDGTAFTNTQNNLVSGAVTVGNGTDLYGAFIMNGGVIKGQKSSVMTSGVGGSAIGLMNKTTFVMNGGEIYSHSAGNFAANVCCTGTCINAGTATITINGGAMYAGRAQNHGAAIYTGGNLYISGGKIVGGQSQNSGAICCTGAEMTVTGGTIIGGKTVTTPGNGTAVDYAKNGGVLTIGGNAIIGGGINVRSSGKLVFTGNAMVDTRLGIEQKFDVRINTGSVHLNNASNPAISSTNGTYKVTYDANGKINGLAAFAATAVAEGTSIPTSGAVKLTAPVTLDATIVTAGELYIDLNGQTVTNTAAGPAIKATHNVIITDSSAEKKGTIKTTTATFTSSASVIFVENGKKVILVAGTLDGSAVTNGYTGSYAGAVTAGNFATFYMLGGEVKGQISSSTGSTGKGGSCIGGWGNSVIVVSGGKLTAASKGTTFPGHAVAAQGTCISSGGDIFVHGGELYGTMATNHGANIYTTGNLTITGGLISGGYSNNSGLISSSGPSLTITGGTLVGGTAHSSSALGGASIDYAKNGGVLTIGGTAKIAGGVSIRSSAKLVLTGKAVIDMNMEGQTQKLFNIRFKNGTCSIYLHDTTGTALASGGTGSYDVTYDAAGNITGITAK